MKNIVSYYYKLDIKKISYDNSMYYIDTDNEKYILKKLEDNVLYLDDNIINQLMKYKYFLKIKKNINNTYITIIDKKRYVLLTKGKYQNYEICLKDLTQRYYIDDLEYKNSNRNWIVLWEKKIDLFENAIYSKKEKYADFISIFNYYIGIGECAILYLKKNCNSKLNNEVKMFASHRRLSTNTKLYEYYDPTNIIIDNISRDLAEYIKSTIINNTFDIYEFENFILENNIEIIELKLFFARLMFPTFIFDYVETTKKLDKNILIEYIKKYENALYNINYLLNRRFNLERVEWIYKNKNKY